MGKSSIALDSAESSAIFFVRSEALIGPLPARCGLRVGSVRAPARGAVRVAWAVPNEGAIAHIKLLDCRKGVRTPIPEKSQVTTVTPLASCQRRAVANRVLHGEPPGAVTDGAARRVSRAGPSIPPCAPPPDAWLLVAAGSRQYDEEPASGGDAGSSMMRS